MDILKKKYLGGCHCKKVLFEFTSLIKVKLIKCNCTICKPLRYLHLIIPHKDFKLISNIKNIQIYQFGTKKAKHFFCKFCGVKSFYQPRSHQNAYSINYNSIKDPPKINQIIKFDGSNFEKNLDDINTI